MRRLITQSLACTQGILRAPTNRSFNFIQQDTFMYRVLYVGILSKGVHPFSFRTRKLSPSEPMVLCHQAGESR